MDWKVYFDNFLCNQPVINGVPFVYAIRDNNKPNVQANSKLLDSYVDQAPLNGDVNAYDANEVRTYIINFITENPTDGNEILPYLYFNDGGQDYRSTKNHYVGSGATETEIVKSADNIYSMFYEGEKKPHM